MTTTQTSTDYVARHAELRTGLRGLHRALPDQMAGFAALHRAAQADGALSAATKELIAEAPMPSACDEMTWV